MAWVEKALATPSWSQHVARGIAHGHSPGPELAVGEPGVSFWHPCCGPASGGDHRDGRVKGLEGKPEVVWQVEVMEGQLSGGGRLEGADTSTGVE
ncbi:hypothetical protein P7K49_009693, partial [Saguinus oedipus]